MTTAWIIDGARYEAKALVRLARRYGFTDGPVAAARLTLLAAGIKSRPALDVSAEPVCACAEGVPRA